VHRLVPQDETGKTSGQVTQETLPGLSPCDNITGRLLFYNYANNTIYPVAVPQHMGSERVLGA
jgi:hypothetical protein